MVPEVIYLTESNFIVRFGPIFNRGKRLDIRINYFSNSQTALLCEGLVREKITPNLYQRDMLSIHKLGEFLDEYSRAY